MPAFEWPSEVLVLGCWHASGDPTFRPAKVVDLARGGAGAFGYRLRLPMATSADIVGTGGTPKKVHDPQPGDMVYVSDTGQERVDMWIPESGQGTPVRRSLGPWMEKLRIPWGSPSNVADPQPGDMIFQLGNPSGTLHIFDGDTWRQILWQ